MKCIKEKCKFYKKYEYMKNPKIELCSGSILKDDNCIIGKKIVELREKLVKLECQRIKIMGEK